MFLISPDKLYPDESLESFLVRLCESNGFESFQLLSAVMWEWLVDNDHQAAGALPRRLSQFNLYHAKHSSGFRVRAFQLLDSLFDHELKPLMQHALLRSSVTFSPHLASVFRDGLHIPLTFLRESYTPVCSLCLQEAPYIRQYWHLKPYQCCHHHGVKLLYRCPDCGVQLNYQESELISYCLCGCDLSVAEAEKASPEYMAISQLVVHGENQSAVSITGWLGALLWFIRHRQSNENDHNASELGEPDFSGAVRYFSDWPTSLNQYLDDVVSRSENLLVKGYNQTRFSDVFGDLLVSSRKLPSRDLRQNFVLNGVIEYLQALVSRHPKSKEANIADVKLTVVEVAALLTTSIEQVYRLYEQGYLLASVRLKLHSKLSHHDAVFFLRHVMELRLAGMASDYSVNDVYLPSW